MVKQFSQEIGLIEEIMFICDILNENGSFKSYREMQLNYNLNVNQFMRYFAIVCAIKSTWRNMFMHRNSVRSSEDHKLAYSYFCRKRNQQNFVIHCL